MPMKCSVCAQEIPEGRYSEHLESEHGVTDDPTAVLIQHLTGLHSTGADEAVADEGLPDEEPSDADAFEEFLAAHPLPSDADSGDEAQDEGAEAPEEDEEPEEAAAHAPLAEEATDEDEFEKMLATYPEVDAAKLAQSRALRRDADRRAEAETAEAAAAGAGAAAEPDADARAFAVWDAARGVTDEPEAEDEGLVVVAPPADRERARRRQGFAMLGLAAAVILAAIAVIYLLTRDTGTKKTTATAPVPTTATTVAATFLPGPQGGAATTVPDTTPATAAPTTTRTTAPTATTAPPAADPASQIAFSYTDASCINNQLSVRGTAANNNPATYSFEFDVQIVNSGGAVLGTAHGRIDHLAAHNSAGFVATGSCTNVTGGHPQQHITSITPG